MDPTERDINISIPFPNLRKTVKCSRYTLLMWRVNDVLFL